jgi:hypothetical protein
MKRPIRLQDQDGNRCARVGRKDAAELLALGYAVKVYTRRGVRKNTIRLTLPLSVVNGGKRPQGRPLHRRWMNRQRYVKVTTVYIERDGRAFRVYSPTIPKGYGSVPIDLPIVHQARKQEQETT